MFKVNPNLDRATLKKAFEQDGQVQIRDFLDVTDAEALWACMAEDVDWRLSFNEGREDRLLSQADLQGMDPQQQMAVLRGVQQRANIEHQYICNRYPLVRAADEGWDLNLTLQNYLSLMQSPEALAMIRDITGKPTLVTGNVDATWFNPGHFRTCEPHNGNETLMASLSLSKDWRGDSGGYLMFYDTDGHVASGIKPNFNCLTLYSNTIPNAISMVAPFANQYHFSIEAYYAV